MTSMSGMSPYPSAVAARMAAPVGVTSSTEPPREYIGAPRRSSTTAGVGRGRRPWSVRTMPVPVGMADAKTRSMPSRSRAIAVPTMSTMESMPPTSWNVTSSTSLRWMRASASASRRKIRWAVVFTDRGSSAASSIMRMLEYVRISAVLSARTVSLVARSPALWRSTTSIS